MAITGRSYPNHPIVLTAQGVQVTGTQAVVVAAPPSRRWRVYNKGTIGSGSGEVKQSPQVNPIVDAPTDRRWLRVNRPFITAGSEAPVAAESPQTIVVVDAPVDRRWLRLGASIISQDVGGESPYTVSVTAVPTDRRFWRVSPPIMVQGAAEPVPGPIVVSTPRNPKVLAPRPIIITTPPEEPALPGSPGLVPLVRTGPNPRPVTQPPTILIGVAGSPTPPAAPADITWCAQTPVTGWLAQVPFVDWATDTSVTNWLATKPMEDC